MLLTGDVGGTNCRLQLWQEDGKHLLHSATLTPSNFPDLTAALQSFLSSAPPSLLSEPITSAFLGICGPIWDDGRSNDPNNVPRWREKEAGCRIHAGDVEKALGWPHGCLRFLNDFEAIGWGLASWWDSYKAGAIVGETPVVLHTPPVAPGAITPSKTIVQIPGSAMPALESEGVLACIGAGTGLGACYIFPSSASQPGQVPYRVHPSEAGMTCSVSPRSVWEWELLRFLQARARSPADESAGPEAHLDCERAVSGPGLVDTYRWVVQVATRASAEAKAGSTDSMGAAQSGPGHSHSHAVHPAFSVPWLRGLSAEHLHDLVVVQYDLVTAMQATAQSEEDGHDARLLCEKAQVDQQAGCLGAAGETGSNDRSKMSVSLPLVALDIFLTWYGRALGTAAATWLPRAGLWVAGGVLPKVLWREQHVSARGGASKSDLLSVPTGSTGPFLLHGCGPLVSAYLAQGPKMRDLVATVPLLLLRDGSIGLRGALFRAVHAHAAV